MIEQRPFAALRRGLARHPYALLGAGARNAWAPPRATTDIDSTLASSTAAVRAIGDALRPFGYVCVR